MLLRRANFTDDVHLDRMVHAVARGILIFIGLAVTYASLQLFQIKMVSVADVVAIVFCAHRRFGSRLTPAAELHKCRIGGVVVVMVLRPRFGVRDRVGTRIAVRQISN